MPAALSLPSPTLAATASSVKTPTAKPAQQITSAKLVQASDIYQAISESVHSAQSPTAPPAQRTTPATPASATTLFSAINAFFA